MGRKRKNRNNNKSSASSGPRQQQQQTKKRRVKHHHERYWVEDCTESSQEAFDHGCGVQLWITRVQLYHAASGTTSNNSSSTAATGGGEEKDAASFAAAAAAVATATAEPTASPTREDAFSKQEMMIMTHEISTAKTSSSEAMEMGTKGVVVEETSKQPEDNIVSSSKDMTDESGSNKCTANPREEDVKSAAIKDDDDAVEEQVKEEDNHPIFTIGIQRHVSARGPIQARPYNSKTPFFHLPHGDCGDGIWNPHDPQSGVADKYWAQRKHLFTRYDDGVLLDPEGWYSVTPEAIANHIAQRMFVASCSNNGDDDDDDDDSPIVNHGAAGSSLGTKDEHEQQQQNMEPPPKDGMMVVLDAFAGVGGNSIAFARRLEVGLVVCVDNDDTRLRMAANNCHVYDIPKNKVVFIHGDATQVLQVYEKGKKKCRQQEFSNTTYDVNKVEIVHGYKYGGLELLPDRLDAIFLSPPWGGSDYGDVGRRHYDLECIHLVTPSPSPPPSTTATTTPTTTDAAPLDGTAAIHGRADDVNKSSLINGKDLLALAAKAVVVKTRNVAYFLPRNTNGKSVAQSASTVPGMRLLEMEQNYLNYKLKTITIYASSNKIKSKAT
jgi:trimethylguanosine synthase